ncbi:HAD family hydrolase [Nocardioides humilatus]|uniref:HAD family hydrolase n=1 Tax=Nocardioides humilatus TaxID=2607660 RepID=A0A5B1LFK6_9ACTN|nr:HAD family hydrolase [Nocardioides humilatus]KAA1419541.1 HAD family hydrolase [Nocardioides humilatus]
MPVSGVLFDLDDTLFDHRGAADRGVRSWLGHLGLDGMLEDHVERWFALEAFHHERFQRREISHVEQRRARIRAFLPGWDLADDTLADDTFAGYLACYRAAWSAFTDAAAALEQALGAGLRVGILTNGDQAIQETKVQRTGLASFGVPVFASSSLPAAKPDPRAFHEVCARLGVAPQDCVMVGDSLRHDVRGASGAGLTAVLVDRAGRYDRRRAEVAGVTRIRSLAELRWAS